MTRSWLGVAALLSLLVSAAGAQGQEVAVDRPGQDLRPGFDLPATDPELCKQACEAEPACMAWTYVKPGGQTRSARCWLKSGVPPAVENECCVSGVKEGASAVTQPAAVTPIQLPAPQEQAGKTPPPAWLPMPLPEPKAQPGRPAPPAALAVPISEPRAPSGQALPPAALPVPIPDPKK
jgi:hypothetical protein